MGTLKLLVISNCISSQLGAFLLVTKVYFSLPTHKLYNSSEIISQYSTIQYNSRHYLLCWWYCTEYRPSPRLTVTCLGLTSLVIFFLPFLFPTTEGFTFPTKTLHLGQISGGFLLSYLNRHIGLGQDLGICNTMKYVGCQKNTIIVFRKSQF